MRNHWPRFAVAILPLLGTTAGGCSPGSKSQPLVDAGQSSSNAAGAADAQSSQNDRTTGQPCSADGDCRGAGGPGTNRCSSDPSFAQTIGGVRVQLWPTPICLEPLTGNGQGNCDPAPAATDPSGRSVHFCDGADEPSSPGICVPLNPTDPQAGQGICYPKCTFGTDGTAPVGCPGHDACVYYAFSLEDASVSGFGYCQGECQQDSDCSALGSQYACQLDLGFCTASPHSRTKGIGTACTEADEASGACNCESGGSSSLGYCTTACVAGGSECPPSWVCDTRETATVRFEGVMQELSVTAPAVGMVGTCAPQCSPSDGGIVGSGPVGADGASDDAGEAGDLGDANNASDASDASVDGQGVLADAGATLGDEGVDDASEDGLEAGSAGEASSGPTLPEGGGEGGLVSPTAIDGGSCPGATICRMGGVSGPDCLP